jgi:hypothetical protein
MGTCRTRPPSPPTERVKRHDPAIVGLAASLSLLELGILVRTPASRFVAWNDCSYAATILAELGVFEYLAPGSYRRSPKGQAVMDYLQKLAT